MSKLNSLWNVESSELFSTSSFFTVDTNMLQNFVVSNENDGLKGKKMEKRARDLW